MTNSTDKERKNGQTVLSMKATINSERKMDLESFYGPTDHHMRETLLTTIFMGMASTNGQMEENSPAIGYAIRCMAEEFLPGMMEGSTQANTTTTRNMDMEFSHGQMEDNMTAHG